MFPVNLLADNTVSGIINDDLPINKPVAY